ncbi:MAG: DUF433 domain-containing protein [Cyanobacteria bacterium SBLK]|nr:DUF433 domain-containing protein [Cyanobacteria bacterium SBLK]
MLGFDRITFDPKIMTGQACIRGMRVPVSLILNLLAHGQTEAEIIEDYPYIEPEDIKQSLLYAAWLANEKIYPIQTHTNIETQPVETTV